MKNATHIFFDLDHTLWDYETNAKETLQELYNEYELGRFFSSCEAFIRHFHYINHQLWDDYNHGRINRDYIRYERFNIILKGRMEEDKKFSLDLSSYFTMHCPRKSRLMPGAIELLESLKNRYELGIITNGFDDIQAIKLEAGGINAYFATLITSESSGYRKPSPEIFEKAENLTGAKPSNTIMIGDNLTTDIHGAKSAGWYAVWYNVGEKIPHKADHEINHLPDLLALL